jgi:hypothetical protein
MSHSPGSASIGKQIAMLLLGHECKVQIVNFDSGVRQPVMALTAMALLQTLGSQPSCAAQLDGNNCPSHQPEPLIHHDPSPPP